MKNLFSFLLMFEIALVVTTFSGCSSEDELKNLTDLPMPPTLKVTKSNVTGNNSQPPKYVYPYSQSREPFFPLTGGTASQNPGDRRWAAENFFQSFAVLSLKGIFKDQKGKIAVLGIPGGESFYLRTNRIYDKKNRVVRGITGIIKNESVVLVTRNKSVKKLYLKGKIYD